MGARVWGWTRLALLALFLGGSLYQLHQLGSDFPIGMITDPGGSFETGLAAALRMAGLVVGYWLGGTTLAYLLAQLVRVPTALRATKWMTWGPIRRLVDGLLTGVLTATLALPATATTTVPGYVPVPAGDPPQGPPTTWAVTTRVIGESIPPEAQADSTVSTTLNTLYLPLDPTPAPVAKTIDPDMVEVVVRAGDNMWKLAENRISAVMGKPASDAEIAPYWLAVIGANLNRIRSGDPDLIFPGEVLVLPAIER